MDVNAIGNKVNSIKAYSNSSDAAQYSNNNTNNANNVSKNVEVSNSKQVEKSQENKNNKENKEGIAKENLDRAVKKLNKFLEDDKTHAEYSVHKELGTTMIKIIDDDTKKVILEVPSQKILDMVASMCEQVGLIDKKA
ncbi:flagellar protein FlaG [Clostridium puniceum]|uniref:Flagellar protein FlaG n=1 Tax=Clostridium puniceum TaxID=29367 RepID=A0A1S8TJN4_9CLOT|nr:flagellar protein FlaG [Clostridium puniceum]OOM77921.1 flagellar protein FlaG [Clostridium puniceum]